MSEYNPNENDAPSPKSLHHQPNGITSPKLEIRNSYHHHDQPPPSSNDRSKPRIYCLNSKQHRPSRPSASQDLVDLYSLTPLANAVTRFDPSTGKKNNMRKSYQGHIKDLPGKNEIKPDSVIREIIRVPEQEADTFVGRANIRRLERDVLEGFGVMPGVIPDFDPSLLGLDDDLSDGYDNSHREGDDSDHYNSVRRKKKRKSEDTDVEALSGTDERKKKRKKIDEVGHGFLGGYR